MSLKDRALEEHAKRNEERYEQNAKQIKEAMESIRKTLIETCESAFGKEPDEVHVDSADYDKGSFTIDGLTFRREGRRYNAFHVVVDPCPECHGERTAYISLDWTALDHLGAILSGDETLDYHSCLEPEETSATAPAPTPAPPPRVVSREERIGAAILELLREEIDAGVEAVLDNRRG